MPAKIFKANGGGCPFGRECEVDTPACRTCEHYQIATSRLFFWCKAGNTPEQPLTQPKKERKRGRPRKNAQKRPYNWRKAKR